MCVSFTLPSLARGMKRVKTPPDLAGKEQNATVTEVSMTEKLKPSKYGFLKERGC